jgi:hypothetical protein
VRSRELPSVVAANHGLNEVNLSGKHGALKEFERSPMTPCAALKFHRYLERPESVDPLADYGQYHEDVRAGSRGQGWMF